MLSQHATPVAELIAIFGIAQRDYKDVEKRVRRLKSKKEMDEALSKRHENLREEIVKAKKEINTTKTESSSSQNATNINLEDLQNKSDLTNSPDLNVKVNAAQDQSTLLTQSDDLSGLADAPSTSEFNVSGIE